MAELFSGRVSRESRRLFALFILIPVQQLLFNIVRFLPGQSLKLWSTAVDSCGTSCLMYVSSSILGSSPRICSLVSNDLLPLARLLRLYVNVLVIGIANTRASKKSST